MVCDLSTRKSKFTHVETYWIRCVCVEDRPIHLCLHYSLSIVSLRNVTAESGRTVEHETDCNMREMNMWTEQNRNEWIGSECNGKKVK